MKDEDDFFWLNVLQPHIAMYMNEFGEVPVRSYTRTEKSMYLDTFWVNYQKQGSLIQHTIMAEYILLLYG